jgi:hypothetical protein
MIGTASLLGIVLLAGSMAVIALRDALVDTLPAPACVRQTEAVATTP